MIRRQHKSPYLPTQKEIAVQCERIRRGWSPVDERHRRWWKEPHWILPVVETPKDVREFLEDENARLFIR